MPSNWHMAALWRGCDRHEPRGADFGPAGCNRLPPPEEVEAHEALCCACRLRHTIPDLDVGDSALPCSRIEVARLHFVHRVVRAAAR